MKGSTTNWEYGSYFEYRESWFQCNNEIFKGPKFSFFNSGRAALVSIIKYYFDKQSGGKILLPTYYCSDVIKYLDRYKIETIRYTDYPGLSPSDYKLNVSKIATKYDLIVFVDYFGNRNIKKYISSKYNFVVDITHSNHKISEISNVCNYAFSSLRKEFPLPDGGWAWVNNSACSLSKYISVKNSPEQYEKFLSGQILKTFFLDGKMSEKSIYLRMMKEAENALAKKPVSRISDLSKVLMNMFSYADMREQRKKNLIYFTKKINEKISSEQLSIISTEESYCLVLKFYDSYTRDYFKRELIKRCIYPFILWPQIDEEQFHTSGSLSKQILCFHADHRYDEKDIDIVIEALTELIKK